MFFRQKNLRSSEVEPLEKPWEVVIPEEIRNLPKVQYKARWRNPDVEHYLLSLAEGLNSNHAVSVDNPAKCLHGFTADYDGVLTEDLIDGIKSMKIQYPPTWWSKSQSGKLHLTWLFERPISVTGNVHACELLKLISRKIHAVNLGVGYDTDSEKVTQVMDIGYDWEKFSDKLIPAEELVLWSTSIFTSQAKNLHAEATTAIPFDKIIEEVHKQYPSAPQDFHEGLRCHRFWDAAADNPTACLVRPEGIVVFTPHDGGFKSWPSLLGNAFCEKYIAKGLAPFYEDTFYVPDRDAYVRFFRHGNPEGTMPKFESRAVSVLKRDLMKEAGLSNKPGKGETLSEVDNALYTITAVNSVTAVAKVIYRPAGKLDMGGGSYLLNTSLIAALKPAPPPEYITAAVAAEKGVPEKYWVTPEISAWDNPHAVEKFPNLYRFLSTMFISETQRTAWEREGLPIREIPDNDARHQLYCLLSWLSYFYKNAIRMTSVRRCGQALILAGDVGRGKSFFAREVLGRLMGGAIDADKFYLENSRFNDNLFDAPIHLIDDRLGSSDRRMRLKFTEQLKVVVANAELRYEKKFGDSRESVPWAGRIVVLCNKDPQALSVLPDLDMSTRDKFMMLMLGTAQFPFGNKPELTSKWLDEELPYFARFLLGWNIPADMQDGRFGVRAWQHDMMSRASAENGITQTLIEALTSFFQSLEMGDADGLKGSVWTGTASQLWKCLQNDDPNVRYNLYSRTCVAQNLKILQRAGYNIMSEENNSVTVWKIPFDFTEKKKSSDEDKE